MSYNVLQLVLNLDSNAKAEHEGKTRVNTATNN